MGKVSERIRNLMSAENLSKSPVTRPIVSKSVESNSKEKLVDDSRIRDLHKKVEGLSKLAYQDELTGLPNRRSFQEELEMVLSMSQNFNLQMAVIFIDMDKFKAINDTHGHEAGDALLKEVAARMTKTLQPPAMVARLGGDEFTSLLPSISGNAEAENIARSLLKSLQPPFIVEVAGNILYLDSTPSIGISVFPSDGNTSKELMKAADLAMYEVKQNGKNNIGFYK